MPSKRRTTRGRKADVELKRLVGRFEAAFDEVFDAFSQEITDSKMLTALAQRTLRPREVYGEHFRFVVVPLTASRVRLSRRERQIARLVAKALPNKAIAKTLGIKPPTVAAHLRQIYRKCGLESRTALATYMLGSEEWDAE